MKIQLLQAEMEAQVVTQSPLMSAGIVCNLHGLQRFASVLEKLRMICIALQKRTGGLVPLILHKAAQIRLISCLKSWGTTHPTLGISICLHRIFRLTLGHTTSLRQVVI